MPIKVPLSWLREYVDINVSPQELARELTLAGIEVEKLHIIGGEWDKVVVGKVTAIERHPNADRLLVAQVDYGAAEPQQVVTGAPNLALGDVVPLAFAGAVLRNGHSEAHELAVLKPTKMRGIESSAMVCSELELGISDEHEGIMHLSPDAPIGAPLQQVLGDTILEIDVTPNLGRIMSMVGLAREVAAIFGGSVRYPSTEWQDDGPPVKDLLQVEIADPDLCPRYAGAVILDAKIGPSPAWMQRRLTLAGMRPISNIVDITNYVMLEMGQPQHAFDYDAVAEHKIIVRRSQPGEQTVTLDHETRTLDGRILVIADPEKNVGLAGVMGGANSEISDNTKSIVLESASFDALNTRRSARLLKLPSEAASRFERTVDRELAVPALKRAAELMRQIAGGTIAHGYVDVYPTPKQPLTLQLTPYEVRRLLGVPVAAGEIAEKLRRLAFEVTVPDGAESDEKIALSVLVPSYRNDVNIPADLVEEVARMIGYDRIPETLIDGGLPPQYVNWDYVERERVRDLLVAAGLEEVLTYSPISRAALARLGTTTDDAAGRVSAQSYDESRVLSIANPLSSEQEILRPTLLPGLISTLRNNLRSEDRVYIFEIGIVFSAATPELAAQRRADAAAGLRLPLAPGEDEMPDERLRAAALLAGPRQQRSRFLPNPGPADATDFWDAKGVAEALLTHLQIRDVSFKPASAPQYHPGRAAVIMSGDQVLGTVGELHPQVIASWELPVERVAALDLDLELLLKVIPPPVRFAGISRFPAVVQDLAVIVPDAVPAARVEALIRQTGGKLLTGVTLFDLYTGQPIPAGNRSLAYSLQFQALDRTLSEAEASKLREKIAGRLQREVGAQART